MQGGREILIMPIYVVVLKFKDRNDEIEFSEFSAAQSYYDCVSKQVYKENSDREAGYTDIISVYLA